jgi:hypothetical protein
MDFFEHLIFKKNRGACCGGLSWFSRKTIFVIVNSKCQKALIVIEASFLICSHHNFAVQVLQVFADR